MPTYDYKCKACGHTWELFQSMSAKHEKTCPECGRKTAERQIGTGAALLFKGSGFYETDYRSEGYKKSAEADKKGGSESTSAAASTGGDAKTPESKPSEAKTATASDTGSKPKKEGAPAPAKPKKKGDKGG
jgi:putative FmdB family regulatory protein